MGAIRLEELQKYRRIKRKILFVSATLVSKNVFVSVTAIHSLPDITMIRSLK